MRDATWLLSLNQTLSYGYIPACPDAEKINDGPRIIDRFRIQYLWSIICILAIIPGYEAIFNKTPAKEIKVLSECKTRRIPKTRLLFCWLDNMVLLIVDTETIVTRSVPRILALSGIKLLLRHSLPSGCRGRQTWYPIALFGQDPPENVLVNYGEYWYTCDSTG